MLENIYETKLLQPIGETCRSQSNHLTKVKRLSQLLYFTCITTQKCLARNAKLFQKYVTCELQMSSKSKITTRIRPPTCSTWSGSWTIGLCATKNATRDDYDDNDNIQNSFSSGYRNKRFNIRNAFYIIIQRSHTLQNGSSFGPPSCVYITRDFPSSTLCCVVIFR